MRAPGAVGYEDIAEAFIERTEALSFENVCRHLLPFFPPAPARVLDVGAASGRDAAALSARGYAVTAVEPTDALREAGRKRHAAWPIDWRDDALPDLIALSGQEGRFDLVIAIAMWMHLSPAEQQASMERIACLLKPGGRFGLSLRHGPFPDNRVGYETTAGGTIALAADQGLACLLSVEAEATQETNRRLGVVWTWLAFEKLR